MALKDIGTAILDALFPLSCRACQEPQNPDTNPDGFVCTRCLASIPVHAWVFCPVCNKKCVGFGRCATHRGALTFLGVASSYQNATLKKLLWDYKYRFVEPLAKPLAALVTGYYRATLSAYVEQNAADWICSFIPLSSARMRWRGFNQAELLVREFSKATGVPSAPLLARARFRRPQMELGTRAERLKNVKDAFALLPNARVAHTRVILIDDVATSGATLEEAGHVLKRAGAKEILGLVVARNDPV